MRIDTRTINLFFRTVLTLKHGVTTRDQKKGIVSETQSRGVHKGIEKQ